MEREAVTRGRYEEHLDGGIALQSLRRYELEHLGLGLGFGLGLRLGLGWDSGEGQGSGSGEG